MSEFPIPEDFNGLRPPKRVVGTETEFDVHFTNQHLLSGEETNAMLFELDKDDVARRAGYIARVGYLDNGMRVYKDNDSFEIASAESVGMFDATQADMATVFTLQRIAQASELDIAGIYRTAASTQPGKGRRTLGYHENYLIPNYLQANMDIRHVLPSFVSTRLWTHAGLLDEEVVSLSQKVTGVAAQEYPFTTGDGRSNAEGRKKMAQIRSGPISPKEWKRLEIRFADPGFNPVARYVGFAATSATLRLFEHEDMIDVSELRDYAFDKPGLSAYRFSSDLTFTEAEPTRNGNKITAMDYQEMVLAYVRELADEVELPEDELAALPYWQEIIDAFRSENMRDGDIDALKKLTHFGERLLMIQKLTARKNIALNDERVRYANLLWDQVDREGLGMRALEVGSVFYDTEYARQLAEQPPQSSAAVRAELLRTTDELTSVKWGSVDQHKGSMVYRIQSPYQTDIADGEFTRRKDS